MTYVIAGNYRQFLMWCHDNKTSPNSKDVRGITRAEQLRGIAITGDDKVERVGTYYQRGDIDEIELSIKLASSRSR